MAASSTLSELAAQALELMRGAGFDAAQASAVHTRLHELNVNHNEASLLRSTDSRKLGLLGLVDGRMASTELADLRPQALRERIAGLFADAASAPQDDANAMSAAQQARIIKGPQAPELDTLADAMRGLLEFRARETPLMMVDEADAKHTLVQSHTLTSGGTDLAASVGSYSMGVFGTARDGKQSSSFNYTGGTADRLAGAAADHFGIAQMLRDTQQQIRTQPLGSHFVGDVVLMPNAVESLLGWLMSQLGDNQLIAGSSLYRDAVGQAIASPLLALRSRFDAPGCAPLSADAHVTPPLDLVRDGVLLALTPSLYGSRKTGLPHVPVAPQGWEIGAGNTLLADLVGGVRRGAIVGRLSMGMPAANGNFSGVIKNSFVIEGGQRGPALSETMISGNMAQMLRDINGVSRERLDAGALLLPWLRIGNLHFS